MYALQKCFLPQQKLSNEPFISSSYQSLTQSVDRGTYCSLFTKEKISYDQIFTNWYVVK